ncbi:glycosyltransferase family 2 protein [Leeuwenhoekiella palythoae]|uniref:Glycosyl transferase family 2 n=1 Tax=Leeuwenhoekiella palythoae TaxID=573501 RepID=A0A1M5Z1I5_9FLAO|nr:glycosyltransferase family A protein [Leeuwenhoekiella palythoae]RXG29749.1 glycosyltransferase involved in cell wall biosynthesis [Leeuwenhoekiella palythoae]SHI17753.1 Glycosyl transferase family 2 [Leeuwenhoekiella palythoae]
MISIVITYFNSSEFINRALYYAHLQKVVEKEIIVVDDGSDNNNKKILSQYADLIDLLITQKNKGQAAARNAGISKATGDFILNWDVDDYFEAEFSSEALKILEEKSNIKLVSSYALRTSNEISGELIKPLGGNYQNFLFENAALGSAMFRKLDWENAGGYDEKIKVGYEDWDFYLRLLYPKGEAFIIPEQLFTYHRHPESTTSLILRERSALIKRKYIYKKNETIYQQHYPELIDDVFYRLEREEQERYKNLERIEYKIGYYILNPLRKLKKHFTYFRKGLTSKVVVK